MKNDLTEYARNGFNANPHLYSSPAWYAHAIGAHFHATGRPIPRTVAMSRGSRVRVNGDLIFSHDRETGWTRLGGDGL